MRLGIAGLVTRALDSCTGALDWLVSSDGRFARDTRELFGIPGADRGAHLRSEWIDAVVQRTAVGFATADKELRRAFSQPLEVDLDLMRANLADGLLQVARGDRRPLA